VQSKGNTVVTDRLGSVRWSSLGGVTGYIYFPYGEERTITSDDREKFGTYTRDGSGQDYADQRYYGVGTARFWSSDPAGLAAVDLSSGLSLNRFAYTYGDPVNFADPEGLDPNCGPYMVWDGEGCIYGAGSPVPDASVPSSVNPYTIFNSEGQQVTGTAGTSSSEVTDAYNDYASEVDQIFNSGSGLQIPVTSGAPLGTTTSPAPTDTSFLGPGGVLADTIGGIVCGASGACEIVAATVGVAAVVYGVWEIGTWMGTHAPITMGGRQTNQYNDLALREVQEGLYPDECAALQAMLDAAKTAAEKRGIVQAQKYAGCRNSGKAR
jgi:RHS repeat-associated protein